MGGGIYPNIPPAYVTVCVRRKFVKADDNGLNPYLELTGRYWVNVFHSYFNTFTGVFFIDYRKIFTTPNSFYLYRRRQLLLLIKILVNQYYDL